MKPRSFGLRIFENVVDNLSIDDQTLVANLNRRAINKPLIVVRDGRNNQ